MIYDAEAGNARIVLGGDWMLGRGLKGFTEPKYLEVVEMFRGADASFVNLEACVRHPDEGTPTLQPATYMTSRPALLDDLKWFGVDLVSIGNNHVFDFGEGGVRAMVQHLRDANIPFTGAGVNMTMARRPCYFDGPKGRIGLVAVTGFFLPWARAGEAKPDAPGRPGLNVLRAKKVYEVSREHLDALDGVAEALGFKKATARDRKHLFSEKDVPAEKADEVRFLGQDFVVGDAANIRTVAEPIDVEDNLRWIREARRGCDYLIVSVHSHDFAFTSAGEDKRSDQTDPADYIVDFSRKAVDAGADIIAGHGSHTPLGLEIYEGKPIFYGLGNMVFHNDTIDTIPAESIERFGLPADATPMDFQDERTGKDTKGHPGDPAFWENFFAECVYEGGKLTSIVFHPIDLGHGLRRSQRGRPVMAEGAVAERVCERVARLSRKLGTQVSVEGGKVVWRP